MADYEEAEADPKAEYVIVPWWTTLLGKTDAEIEAAVADLYSRGSGDGKGGLNDLLKDLPK